VGIATAYYCAKKGLKVLGLEQFSKPGAIGSSSFGETRLWRTTHDMKFRNDMMKDALKEWKELEEESGEELLVHTPVLTLGSIHAQFFKDVLDQFPDKELMTPEEISKKFPALKNIPEDYKGFLHDECGIVRARKALLTTKAMAEKHGAKLIFNTKVTKISKNEVQTEDGTTYRGKNVVVSCGAYTLPFTK